MYSRTTLPRILPQICRACSDAERAADAASNGFDWLFRREQLVLSGLTDHEVIHQGDPMSVRYYSLAQEDRIDLVDGSTLAVQHTKHAIPLVLVPPLGVT